MRVRDVCALLAQRDIAGAALAVFLAAPAAGARVVRSDSRPLRERVAHQPVELSARVDPGPIAFGQLALRPRE